MLHVGSGLTSKRFFCSWKLKTHQSPLPAQCGSTFHWSLLVNLSNTWQDPRSKVWQNLPQRVVDYCKISATLVRDDNKDVIEEQDDNATWMQAPTRQWVELQKFNLIGFWDWSMNIKSCVVTASEQSFFQSLETSFMKFKSTCCLELRLFVSLVWVS